MAKVAKPGSCKRSLALPGNCHAIPVSSRAPRPRRKEFAALLLAILAIAASFDSRSSLSAQEGKHSEYEVKAAYLYNFGKFVRWHDKSASRGADNFTICVLGRDPFGAMLDATIEGATIDGTNVVSRRIAKASDSAGCRILFISSSEDNQLREILSALGTMSVLTVSDLPQFARRGGIIQFVMEDNRVRFEINQASAEHAGLTLSSQLLKLAVIVRSNSPPGD